MANLIDYFNKVTYKPKYIIGDRVRGLWNNIPFSGSVQIDTLLDEYEGPYVIVYSDLPIKHDGNFLSYIKVKHEDIIDNNQKYDINRKTNTKK